MSTLNIHRVNALPEILEAHSLYVIKRQEFGLAELVFTSSAGEPFKVIDSASVQTLIGSAINNKASIEIVGNIEERNSLNLTSDAMVYVLDASADENVPTGSALYAYKNGQYVLILSAGNTNSRLSWDNITDGPSSTPVEIDAAVQAAHSHTNGEVLDGISEIDGRLYYKGNPVSEMVFVQKNW